MKSTHNLVRAALLFFAVAVFGVSGCKKDSDAHSHEGHSHNHEGDEDPLEGHKHDAGETCYRCDAAKREKGRLWCKEHARYEDRCWKCQPQMRDSKRAYCDQHKLYKDECHLCDPARKKGGEK